MRPKWKAAAIHSAIIAVVYTIIQFVTPYIFSSFTKHTLWIYLVEGLVFFLLMTPAIYYLDNKKKKR